MNFTLWSSTESIGQYFADYTDLKNHNTIIKHIAESDANTPREFHKMPDHIKKILYLDAPDLIIEYDNEPILAVEISSEAGTGHNVFQRFARIAAALENEVPMFYIYPEATIVTRQSNSSIRWDVINKLVFKALDNCVTIFGIPAMLYYFPSDYNSFKSKPKSSPHLMNKGLILDSNRTKYGEMPDHNDPEISSMLISINKYIHLINAKGIYKARTDLVKSISIQNQLNTMKNRFYSCNLNINQMSPVSSTVEIETQVVLNYLSRYNDNENTYGNLLRSRAKCIVYKINAKFRGDPYPGCIAAIDYLICRNGKTYEDREKNLILLWGDFDVIDDNISFTKMPCSIDDFVHKVQNSEKKNLLNKNYRQLKKEQIPRYYMQVRYGSTYTKVKEIRVFSYFADAILFHDGSLWRDA
jgi:hypothetical protein